MQTQREIDYGLGTVYAIVTAFLFAVQEPFSALAARTLTSLDFFAFTQLALLFSLPFLLAQDKTRRDFAAILLDIRQWPKLAVIFLVGVAGLGLYDVGLSSTHPIITAAVLNLSPFWAVLVAFAVSRRSISVPRSTFILLFVVAFFGAMAVAWSQIDVDNRVLARDVIFSLLHSKWIYALPTPVFFALSGTLVYHWFSDFDERAAIGANFVVSATVLLPAAVISPQLHQELRLSEQSASAIALLLVGTLAAAAAGRLFYQLALTATQNDNGYVTMFFLLIPGISALISLPLSSYIPTLMFVPGPLFVLGMGGVSLPLAVLAFVSRRGNMRPI
jgi:drug/metabolite transporter (DMT)-like permease